MMKSLLVHQYLKISDNNDDEMETFEDEAQGNFYKRPRICSRYIVLNIVSYYEANACWSPTEKDVFISSGQDSTGKLLEWKWEDIKTVIKAKTQQGRKTAVILLL
jgi:hypothetical protein